MEILGGDENTHVAGLQDADRQVCLTPSVCLPVCLTLQCVSRSVSLHVCVSFLQPVSHSVTLPVSHSNLSLTPFHCLLVWLLSLCLAPLSLTPACLQLLFTPCLTSSACLPVCLAPCLFDTLSVSLSVSHPVCLSHFLSILPPPTSPLCLSHSLTA